MRFLLLNWRDPSNPKSGGAERVSRAYLSALARRGHEVFWFANDFPGGRMEEQVDGISVIRGGKFWSSVLKANNWSRHQKPFDLVIDQHHGIPWYAPWWCKTNSVAYIHEVLGPIWNAFHSWPVSSIGQWQERWTIWFYRNTPFWTPSESTRKTLLALGVRSVNVFPNGTDATPLAQLDEKPLTLPLRLVAVSRLAVNKRVDHALRVVHRLVSQGIPTHLTVVGGGETEASLKRLSRDLNIPDRVVFAGALSEDDKNLALRRSHFLIHTSIREGWGLNVIEANAMGTPAAVYPVDGLVDSTLPDVTGLVAAAENIESLATCLMRAVKNPGQYRQLRKNAWLRSKSFAWNLVLPPACDWLEAEARRKHSAEGRITSPLCR
jgi:glycosyltransferase involved in cell wall biosynthesis